MKTLAFGVVLILLLGVAGFFYRNVMEQETVPEPVACTLDAKMCPDGSAVGRTGPSCEFAVCAFPNVELAEAGVAFVLPEGYATEEGGDGALLAAFAKNATTTSVSTITLHRYMIPEGKDADDVILAHTRYQPADMQAEDFERFTQESLGGQVFRATVIERFEGVVQSAYFLARANDVLMFSVVEKDVMDWMEPDLDVDTLPEHAALRKMLSKLQVSE